MKYIKKGSDEEKLIVDYRTKYFSDQIGTTKGQNNVDYEIIHIRLQIFLKKINVVG